MSRPVPTGRLILRLIAYLPWRYAGNALAWTVVWAMPIVPGLISREFFNGISGEAPARFGVPTLIAFLGAYALARIGIVALGMVNDANLTFRLGALVRRNMLGRILELPGARAVPHSPGEAISRFREDIETTEEAVAWTADLLGVAIFAAVSMAVLASIDGRITLFVFAPLVVVVAVAERTGSLVRRYRAEARRATGEVTAAIGETFGAVQSVKVAGAEAPMLEHFRSLNERRRKVMVRDRVLNEMLESVFWNTVNVGTALILLLAAGAMRGGAFTVGDFALFVYVLTFVTDAVHFVGIYLARYRQAGVALERMVELLQGADPKALVAHRELHLRGDHPAPAAPPPVEEPLEVLEATGLTYRYPGTEHGIEGVDLRLERGSFTVVTGRIGSGKTTLLRVLLGLLPADGGEIRWNGRPVPDPASFFVPPRSAYTPQIPRLFSMSLRDNLLLGLAAEDEELAEAIRAAVLDDDLAAMPAGLETAVGPLGVRLSGGQVQRTAAARMFVRRPELLVFDDLSSALDVETERLLWERLFARTPRPTSLVVSHRRAALEQADQVIVLEGGEVGRS